MRRSASVGAGGAGAADTVEPDIPSSSEEDGEAGGGGNGGAFGPSFKNADVRMHNADESMDKENFFKHAQICLEAMYRMFTDGE